MYEYEPTKKAINKIKRTLRIKQYSMDQFFKACPFTVSDLKSKNREHELVSWRHLGMTWSLLSGKKLTDSAAMFNRKHATAINSLTAVLHAFEGYGSPVLVEAIERVKEYGITSGVLVPTHKIADFLTENIGDPDEVARLTPILFELINKEATR